MRLLQVVKLPHGTVIRAVGNPKGDAAYIRFGLDSCAGAKTWADRIVQFCEGYLSAIGSECGEFCFLGKNAVTMCNTSIFLQQIGFT